MLRSASMASKGRMVHAAKCLQDRLQAVMPELQRLAAAGACRRLLAGVEALLTSFPEAFIGSYTNRMCMPLVRKVINGFLGLQAKLGEAHMQVSHGGEPECNCCAKQTAETRRCLQNCADRLRVGWLLGRAPLPRPASSPRGLGRGLGRPRSWALTVGGWLCCAEALVKPVYAQHASRASWTGRLCVPGSASGVGSDGGGASSALPTCAA
jgi:hypothetical protein